MIELPCLELAADQALPLITEALARLGLQVLPSFDLQVARAVHTRCDCPHHGSQGCDCQMVVLLLYGQSGAPSALVLHGHRGKTYLSLVDTPQQRPEAGLPDRLRQALLANLPAS
jgi:hypothetical protein